MPTEDLTQTRVKAAKAASGSRLEIWDEKAPGLCLRVTDKGVKSWVLRYRSRHGGQPRFKFGDATRMGLVEARREAYRLKGEIAQGNEPAAHRRSAKAEAEARTIKTFGDLLDAYEQACAIGEWKPKMKPKREQTIAYEKVLTDRHIRPALGSVVHFRCRVQITSAGTGSGVLTVALPAPARFGTSFPGYGVAGNLGAQLYMLIQGSEMVVTQSGGGSVIAGGADLYLSGTYEAA